MEQQAQSVGLNRRERRKRGFTRRASALLLTGLLVTGGVSVGGMLYSVPAANAVELGAGVWFGGDVGAGSFKHSNGTIVYCAELGKATVMGNNPAMGATSSLPAYHTATYMISGQTFTDVGTGALSGTALKQFNYVLSHYGSTNDNAQAGAVQIALWKIRSAGSTQGYKDALAYMENGVGGSVVSRANSMIAEAANGDEAANAPGDPRIIPGATPYTGTVIADPGTTKLTLGNAVFTTTGTNTVTFPGGAKGEVQVPFVGQPPLNAESWDRHYRVTVKGSYEYTASSPNVLYGTPGGLGQGLVSSPAAVKKTGDYDAVYIDPDTIWSPELSTQVPSDFVKKGESFSDTVTFAVAKGSNAWRYGINSAGQKRYAPITAKGTLYGPFLSDPADNPSATPPKNAPIAATAEVTTGPQKGPGTYEVTSAGKSKETGYYSWVWNIEFAGQAKSVTNPSRSDPSIPKNYFFTDGFGKAAEGQVTPTDLELSTNLKSDTVTLDKLTLTDVVDSKLVEGGWLQAGGKRIPATVRLTAYGQNGPIEQTPLPPTGAKEIARTTVVLNGPKEQVESPEMKISLEDYKAFEGGAVQACIVDEDQPEASRGFFTETCDDYGAKNEVFKFVKPAITTKAQEKGSLEELANDTAIVKDSDLPEGSTIGATAYLRPKTGDFRYDENWKPVLGEDGKPVKWTQEMIDAIDPAALCEVQPVGKTERIPAKNQGEYPLPGIVVKSEGSGIDWVEDTEIPHPENGEPVEWSRGKCGVENEYTPIPKPGVSTKAHLSEGFPTDTNWDNVIVKDLAVSKDSRFSYEATVDAFWTKDAKATPRCDVKEKVWTSKTIQITGSGEFATNKYKIRDVTKTDKGGRLDHVEKLIRVEKETGKRTVIAEGECGAVTESTTVNERPVTPVPPTTPPKTPLAVTGGADLGIVGAAAAALLALGAGAVFYSRRRRLAHAPAVAEESNLS